MTLRGIESRSANPPSLFIHIGAGEGDLADLARSARRAVLIEPDPERFETLKSRLAGAPRAQAVNAALSTQAGSARFWRYSLPRFSALAPAAGARTLFRGLRETDVSEVATVRLADVVRPTAEDKDVLVVVDAPNEAATALEQLEALDLIRPGCAILVRVAEIALHDGGPARTDLQAWAEARGLKLERVEEDDDPDIWRAWLTMPGGIPAEKKAPVGAAGGGDEATARPKPDETAIQNGSDALGAANAEIKKLREALAAREADLEKAAETQSAMKRQLETATERLTEQRDAASRETKEARADLGVSLRTQRLLQADLQDLQQRYGELDAAKQSLEELLASLMDHLYDATDDRGALGWKEGDDARSERRRSSPSDG